MSLHKTDREEFQKRSNLIPKMKKSENANLLKRRLPQTNYLFACINRLQQGRKLKNKNKTVQNNLQNTESINDVLVVSYVFHMWKYVDKYQKWTFLVIIVWTLLNKVRNRQRIICAKIFLTYFRSSCFVVFDDEKYFTYDDSNMQGNDNYYTNDKSKFPDSFACWKRDISEQSNDFGSHIQ